MDCDYTKRSYLWLQTSLAFNPYWETRGRTYEDPDGYRVVLQQAEWSNVEKP